MADQHKALERIGKLIALSASSSVEEARTAAHQACALIREHGFVVTTRTPSTGRSATSDAFDAFMRDYANSAPDDFLRDFVKVEINRNAASKSPSICMPVPADRSAQCDVCKRYYSAGEEILLTNNPKNGVAIRMHVACRKAYDVIFNFSR